MTRVRIVLRLAALIVHTLVGLFCALVIFVIVGARGRAAITRWWSKGVLRISGMRLDIANAPRDLAELRGALLVCNHISWIDIYVLNALIPARFVAKAEIRGWPIIGLLAKRSGTLFIERGRRHAVHNVLQSMAKKLKAGEPCIIFPEGTTSDGTSVLPFHANLLQAAFEAGVPIRPLALRYLQDGATTTIPAYVGDDVLIDSVVRVFGASHLQAQLHILAPINPRDCATRHEAAAHARSAITGALRLPLADTAPATGADPVPAPRP
ncbi:MAG TPA: lysophospholipid acyltransferase family protein [Burkholderiaceae bacterium]|nr:lysophospholipid acyltransferase family protein [Burkholderiaceae bacterium]